MVVQLFVTLGLIFTFAGQLIQVALLLRSPLEVILRFEYHFCFLSFCCNAFTGMYHVENTCSPSGHVIIFSLLFSTCDFSPSAGMMFLSIVIFGSCCWARDWLLYPNWNYPSWSYAFAVFSTLIHIFAALLMFKVGLNQTILRNFDFSFPKLQDYRDAKERKEKNKALIMQMQPPGFSNGSHHHLGYI